MLKIGDKVRVKCGLTPKMTGLEDYELKQLMDNCYKVIGFVNTEDIFFKGSVHLETNIDTDPKNQYMFKPEWLELISSEPILSPNKTVGVKHDSGKPDLSLLPHSAKELIAKAFMVGEKKYGRYNYKGGMEWTRLLAALERHASAFNAGEDLDPETGLPHIAHAGACVMMLLDYYANNLGTDNRYKK